MLKLQIIYPTGEIVNFPAGGAIETDMIESIVFEVMQLKVGYRSSSHVEKDVREGIKTALYKFKSNILKVPVKLSR